MGELDGLLRVVNAGGVAGVLLIVTVILAREYRRLERRCDRWQRLALNALSDADRAAGLADFFREDRS